MKRFLKYPQYFIEALLLYLFFFSIKVFPQKLSSKLVSSLVRFFAKFHSTNQIAYDNLKNAFPEKPDQEIWKIIDNCWKNLGIIGAEFDKVTNSSAEELAKTVVFENEEFLIRSKQLSKSLIFLSAHIGNWELASRLVINYDPDTALIYRKAKNPLVEQLIQKCRKRYAKKIIPKGEVAGFKDILKQLKKGGSLGILADQHLTSGVVVNFFGRKVKAPQTPAEFAIKFKIPIIMSRVIRLEDGTYKCIFEPPIIIKETDNVNSVTQEIYDIYEKWIRHTPEQWFWMHKRWRKI